MKEMIKMFSISVLLIMEISCAATRSPLPEKYNLDHDLEAVDQISSFKVSNWEQVDNQSIILKADRNDYYLIILRRPIDGIIPGLSIGISSGVSSITPGFDRIIVKDNSFTEYYTIDKIYKLKGKEEAEVIKERLRDK